MYNQITITPTELVVSPAGLDRLWALKGAIRVPWRHVTERTTLFFSTMTTNSMIRQIG